MFDQKKQGRCHTPRKRRKTRAGKDFQERESECSTPPNSTARMAQFKSLSAERWGVRARGRGCPCPITLGHLLVVAARPYLLSVDGEAPLRCLAALGRVGVNPAKPILVAPVNRTLGGVERT